MSSDRKTYGEVQNKILEPVADKLRSQYHVYDIDCRGTRINFTTDEQIIMGNVSYFVDTELTIRVTLEDDSGKFLEPDDNEFIVVLQSERGDRSMRLIDSIRTRYTENCKVISDKIVQMLVDNDYLP